MHRTRRPGHFPLQRIVRGVVSSALTGAALSAGAAAPAGEPASAASASSLAAPPVAAVHPHAVDSPNGVRNDDYYWLRDDTRESPPVLDYLRAENAWYAQYSARYAPLEAQLFAEMKGRIKEDDSSVPFEQNGDWYATRFEQGKDYPIHVWHRARPGAPEQVLLDVNALAEGRSFYQVAQFEVSDGKKWLAYSEDTGGRRQYVIRVKNLATGELLPDAIPGTSGAIAWAADDKTFFYVENDATTLRSRRVKRHVLGTDPARDVVVHDEADESYYTGVHRSGSRDFVVIELSSTESDEQRVLRADKLGGAFAVLAPRAPHFHYRADHIARRWVVLTDWEAPNYRVMQVADGRIGDRARWKPLLAQDPQVLIAGIQLFDHYLVLDERGDALHRLRVQRWNDGVPSGAPQVVRADEPAYAATLGDNMNQHTGILRYRYTSLITPPTVFDLDMATGQRTLRKRQEVLGGYDASQYVTERVWAKARDGTALPISLVRRKSTPRDGTAPLYVYGYGSYGFSTDAQFSAPVLSLLDRGFVYAIAHVRGGEEMGRRWYEDGKKLHKRNTFTDFIDATEALVAQGYGDRKRVFASGRSAGGLLMGAIVNLRPDLYRGVVAGVPFVDVVTTMLDETIPLTTNEFDEWGNPKQKAFYDYMLSYSPYDNVTPRAYPALMVATGLFDSQVQYYEPAKWVAKLRAAKRAAGDDAQPLVFKVNMAAGHGGSSGRFTRLRETAGEYAFMVDLAGIAK
ncbi:MAG: S9 family peptidase [Betaproteobacteria bacterium]